MRSVLFDSKNCPSPYPAIMHIGRIKLRSSQGVLYGMIEYAMKSPSAHRAVNMAKRCFALTKVNKMDSVEIISIGDSSFNSHFT